ncbi:MAG: hypothetical protein AB7F35_17410 [Acetobacteraceae bacterium]
MACSEPAAPPGLKIRLFGHLSVEDDAGNSLLPRTRKARAVLAYLALASPRPVLRSQLTSLLWSQRENEQARGSLRQALHDLQENLGAISGHFLLAERHILTLMREGLWVDVLEAQRITPSSVGDLSPLLSPLLEDLVGLDPAFDNWLEKERQRVTRLRRAMGETLLADQQDPTELRRTAEELLAGDPAHEAAWQTIMRFHLRRGERAAVLAAYEQCRAAMTSAGETTLSPDTEELAARARQSETPGQSNAFVHAAAPTSVGRSGIRIGITPLRLIGSLENEALSIGLSEEITTALSRFRWISCVSATSWAALAGETGLEVLWPNLNLDYILDGTIQQAGERLRISVRLMDMRVGGTVIWARRFDPQTNDALAVQDEVAAAIVAQLDPALLIHEGERAAASRVPDPSAQDLILQSVPAIYRLERSGFQAAGPLLEHAITTAPGNAIAHAWYAYWHLFLVGQGWAERPAEATRRAVDLAERAVTLDPGDARSLTLAGHVRGFLGKRASEAAALHDRALILNPNLAMAWCFSGLAYSYLGNHNEALRRMYQAVRLSPSDPHLFFFDMALIMPHLLLAEYESAAEVGRRAIELNPWFSSSYKGHLAALGYLERDSERERILSRLLELEPGFSVEEARARSPISRPEDLDRYVEGLRRAGLPERGSNRSAYLEAAFQREDVASG